MAPLNPFHDFRVLGPAIGHFSAGHDFPAEDPEGPDVRFGGEPGVVEHFGGRPLNGELGSPIRRVLVVNDIASKTKVGHLKRKQRVMKKLLLPDKVVSELLTFLRPE